MRVAKKIANLEAKLVVVDVIIEYLSVSLAKYRVKKKNLREELKVCRSLEKDPRKN